MQFQRQSLQEFAGVCETDYLTSATRQQHLRMLALRRNTRTSQFTQYIPVLLAEYQRRPPCLSRHPSLPNNPLE